jgi:hypothetical protein
MPRIAFSPKAIKSRIDDFVVAQDRAKRILSTAMHNQRLRIQQLEQYQRDLLSEEREQAERLRREAGTHQTNDPSNEILTDFEGQSDGCLVATASPTSKPCKYFSAKVSADGRPNMDTTETTFSIRKVQCHVTGTHWMWQDSSRKNHG